MSSAWLEGVKCGGEGAVDGVAGKEEKGAARSELKNRVPRV